MKILVLLLAAGMAFPQVPRPATRGNPRTGSTTSARNAGVQDFEKFPLDLPPELELDLDDEASRADLLARIGQVDAEI
jgi:hypothetical protein